MKHHHDLPKRSSPGWQMVAKRLHFARWIQLLHFLKSDIWPAASFFGHSVKLTSLAFNGAEIAQCRVPSTKILEPLNVIETSALPKARLTKVVAETTKKANWWT